MLTSSKQFKDFSTGKMKTNSTYCREKLFEAEHGICQMCQLDAHSLYKQIKSQPDLKKRVKILQGTELINLNSKQKESIVKKPTEGLFWQGDHIKGVFEGGGQCEIDNYRTLCVLCHRKVTTDQARQRAQERQKSHAKGTLDIRDFFQHT